MKKSYSIKPFRLNIYYAYVGSFDFLDKTSDYNYYKKRFSSKIQHLILQNKINFVPQNKINILTMGFSFEILTNQRFLLGYLKKKSILKNIFLKVTLQKKTFFLFLDIFLHSLFLNKFYSFTLSKTNNLLIFYGKDFLQSFHFLFSNRFINNLNFLTSFLLNLSWIFNLFSSKLINIDFLNLYFLLF